MTDERDHWLVRAATWLAGSFPMHRYEAILVVIYVTLAPGFMIWLARQ